MRSHYCGHVNESLIDETVTVCGWVHRRRDHGGVIFLDLRDREGLLQVVFDPDTVEAFALAETLRSEFIVKVEGRVRARPEGTVNNEMPTGQIEVLGLKLELISQAKTPPFPLDEHQNVGDDVRLKYRYIDLRRPELVKNIKLRAQLASHVRRYLESSGYLEIETPMLTKATPEGARDYLVPSRVHPGEFYALPQSPQLFKQLFMISGLDKYYQIVKCFRDEDLRADRQPEFTQIDIEASFVDEEAIMGMAEELIQGCFKELLEVELDEFPRMTYADAMRRFGSDKPDLRIKMELVDVDDLVKNEEFKVFAEPANRDGGRVAALCVPGAASVMSRKVLDSLPKFVSAYGAKGLAYIKVNEQAKGREGLQSPIVKNLSDDALQGILSRVSANDGDVIFFGADTYKVVSDALGALRLKLAADLDLIEDSWKPLWVVEFPMFEEADGRFYACHHPFTSPVESVEKVAADPVNARARAYDCVLNGTELGGGSVRIADYKMQLEVLGLLGIDQAEAQSQFGFLLDALQYGAPPHAGIAFGLDRLVMLMTGATSIREVIPFPKTQSASCLMTEAPSKASFQQLNELHLKAAVVEKAVVEKAVSAE